MDQNTPQNDTVVHEQWGYVTSDVPSNFSYLDMNYTGEHEDYPNPFDRLDVQVIFILLYGLVFASSFIGK